MSCPRCESHPLVQGRGEYGDYDYCRTCGHHVYGRDGTSELSLLLSRVQAAWKSLHGRRIALGRARGRYNRKPADATRRLSLEESIEDTNKAEEVYHELRGQLYSTNGRHDDPTVHGNGHLPNKLRVSAHYIGPERDLRKRVVWIEVLRDATRSLTIPKLAPECPFCNEVMRELVGHSPKPSRITEGHSIKGSRRYECAWGHRIATNGTVWW